MKKKFDQLIWAFSIALAMTALFSRAAEGTTLAGNQQKPNILMILVDDMGYSDLGCYGSKIYQTPHIDQLAAQGLRFTDAYAAAHICSPSRAAILTGKYPARLHLTDWIPGHVKKGQKLLIPDWTKELDDAEVTIGESLKRAGYATAWFGKWHVGGQNRARGQGFDAGDQDWDLNSKKDEADPKGVFTLNQQAIEFMKDTGDKPFFVCVSHYAVHTPVRFDNKLKKQYEKKGIPDEFNAGYCAMIEVLDESVGRLLGWLEGSGLAQNTLVMFYSDNGGLTKYTNNTPLREGKGTLYEGGTRVPLIARWPGVIQPGTKTSEMVSGIDLLPTFTEIGGAPPPEGIDGISLRSMLAERKPLGRDTLYWHYPHYHQGMPGSSIRRGNYKLIEFFESGQSELYNLSNDLSEKVDLSAKMPEKRAEMLADLAAWRKKVGAQMMHPNPDFKKD